MIVFMFWGKIMMYYFIVSTFIPFQPIFILAGWKFLSKIKIDLPF